MDKWGKKEKGEGEQKGHLLLILMDKWGKKGKGEAER